MISSGDSYASGSFLGALSACPEVGTDFFSGCYAKNGRAGESHADDLTGGRLAVIFSNLIRYERWSQRAAERALRPSRRLKVGWASVSYRLPDAGGAPQRISSLSYTSACSSYWFDLCLTSKMSHGGRWRGSGVSQNRDIYRSWLHRIVRRYCLDHWKSKLLCRSQKATSQTRNMRFTRQGVK